MCEILKLSPGLELSQVLKEQLKQGSHTGTVPGAQRVFRRALEGHPLEVKLAGNMGRNEHSRNPTHAKGRYLKQL